jgi:hypothetical protein
MRQISTVFSVVLLASSAFADASRHIAAQPIVLTNLGNHCQPVSEVPRSARTPEPVFSARVSTANCMASAKLASLPLTDSDASIERANQAVAPIIANLDEVIAEGDPNAQLVAAYAKGDLLFGLRSRMRDAIPSMTSQMSLQSVRDIEQRRRALEPKLSPWSKEATTAFLRVMATARENPKLSRDNPVVQYMIRDAEQRVSLEAAAPTP